MPTGVEIDLRQMEKALSIIAARKQKTFEQVAGRASYSIAIKALKNTVSATFNKLKEKYQTEVRTDITRYKRGKKAGQISKKISVWNPSKYTYAMAMRGYPGLRFSDPMAFYMQAIKLAARKVMSAGFIKSGWLVSIDKFAKYRKGNDWQPTGKALRAKNRRESMRAQGTATMQGTGDQVEAEVTNRTLIGHDSAGPMAESALRSAISSESAQLVKQAEAEMNKMVKEAGF